MAAVCARRNNLGQITGTKTPWSRETRPKRAGSRHTPGVERGKSDQPGAVPHVKRRVSGHRGLRGMERNHFRRIGRQSPDQKAGREKRKRVLAAGWRRHRGLGLGIGGCLRLAARHFPAVLAAGADLLGARRRSLRGQEGCSSQHETTEDGQCQFHILTITPPVASAGR